MIGKFWRRLVKGVKHLRQRADWPDFTGSDWADRIMRVEVTDQFHAKQGRTTGRWVLGNQDHRLVVYLKRHYRLPMWQGILATLFPRAGWSPAVQEWRNLRRARALGLPVPTPVAAAEYIGPWCKLQSFLAVEELTDMVALHEAIPEAAGRLEAKVFEAWKRGLIVELAHLTHQLHAGRHYHKDLYLCHFFIPRSSIAAQTSWRGQVHLIDLHRFRYHPIAWRRWQIKDLAQLLYSSDIPGIGVRDRIRFWRVYKGPRGIAPRFLRILVLWKYRQYRRHNARNAA